MMEMSLFFSQRRFLDEIIQFLANSLFMKQRNMTIFINVTLPKKININYPSSKYIHPIPPSFSGGDNFQRITPRGIRSG